MEQAEIVELKSTMEAMKMELAFSFCGSNQNSERIIRKLHICSQTVEPTQVRPWLKNPWQAAKQRRCYQKG